ncbi:MAG: glycosyltransferase family 2 protein [Acidimicrobiia bacterium]|nr:glycosyltransferase family 2 protein [Acidimicrobiia bacterium]
MSTSTPLVSIGLPVYNGENYLADAIKSHLGQTLTDFELVISDNGSTDATEAICRRFAAQDSRIRYYRSDVNRGIRWNLPRVFELARGTYFRWAAHDDLVAPTMLEACLDVLEKDPSVALCMPKTLVIDDESRIVRFPEGHFTSGCVGEDDESHRLRLLASDRPAERFRGVLLMSLRCHEIFGLARREQMAGTGLYRGYNGSEKVFLAELALIGRYVELDEPLFYNRWHDERASANRRATGQNQVVDPRKSKRLAAPHEIRTGLGYLSLIPSADVSLWERVRCLGVFGRFALRLDRWQHIINKLITGKSNTALVEPELERGERVSVPQVLAQDEAPAGSD